jgi:hypothetical protein
VSGQKGGRNGNEKRWPMKKKRAGANEWTEEGGEMGMKKGQVASRHLGIIIGWNIDDVLEGPLDLKMVGVGNEEGGGGRKRWYRKGGWGGVGKGEIRKRRKRERS